MKLSLSVRVAESVLNKEEANRSMKHLADLARQLGYAAMCMRASQAGIKTPLEQITRGTEDPRRTGSPRFHGDGGYPHTRERRTRPGRPAEHHALPGPDRVTGRRPDPDRHEEGRRYRLGAAGLGRGGRTEHPARPPVPHAQPLRNGGGVRLGPEARGASEFRHHLRAGQSRPVRPGLRPGDHPAFRALAVQRLSAEPPPEPGRVS